jgi:hypothetical protein
MQDDAIENGETPPETTDWAELRARAEKLGISLGELQQRDREKKARLAKKHRSPLTREKMTDKSPRLP